ncbi:hypothetical protein M3Y99_00111800 [Aphelenchoides fujianensis]|nr:hypothetical protein M3Y99_00111800 [Aphelenchoides fujianensis]
MPKRSKSSGEKKPPKPREFQFGRKTKSAFQLWLAANLPRLTAEAAKQDADFTQLAADQWRALSYAQKRQWMPADGATKKTAGVKQHLPFASSSKASTSTALYSSDDEFFRRPDDCRIVPRAHPPKGASHVHWAQSESECGREEGGLKSEME